MGNLNREKISSKTNAAQNDPVYNNEIEWAKISLKN